MGSGHGSTGSGIQPAALLRFRTLDAAMFLVDLRLPTGNGMEKLKGDRAGRHRVRMNQQSRICVRWRSRDAYDVGIVDSHQEDPMPVKRRPPIHRGEVLLEEEALKRAV